MIRTLFIITGASLVLAAVCLGGAAALGGRDLARHGWTWTIKDSDGESIRFERVEKADRGPHVTRTLTWNGGEVLGIDLAAEVRFVQGASPSVIVRGPREVVERVTLENGRLDLADGREQVTVNWDRHGIEAWSDSEDLQIVVTAPNVNRFDVRGSGRLAIENYDQPTLAVDLSGSGQITGRGRARTVEVDIAGSGEVDLDEVQTTDATVEISGSGEATIAPTGQARIDISGSGDVTLATKPANVISKISGSGDVHQD